MIVVNLKHIYTHLINNFVVYLSLFIILFSFIITFYFPVYFRADDVLYLNWAKKYTNPFLVFNPPEEIFKLWYRPILLLLWWCLYHLFELNSTYYQIVVFLFYGFSFVFFYKFVENAFSKNVALLSLIAYFLVFYFLGYIIFWFSDLTFILQLFFMNLSLYLFVVTINGKSFLIWGFLIYICAFLSKEPRSLSDSHIEKTG